MIIVQTIFNCIVSTEALCNSGRRVMEGNEVPNGWPLGLGSMRMGVAAASPAMPPPRPAASRLRRSPSFSSCSSSDLDTESTASFFPDRSVSLGRLIGIEAVNMRIRPCGNEGNVRDERSRHHAGGGGHKGRTHNSDGGICAPLLRHVIGRIVRRRCTSGQC